VAVLAQSHFSIDGAAAHLFEQLNLSSHRCRPACQSPYADCDPRFNVVVAAQWKLQTGLRARNE
jgi:hypothetical protein